MIDRLTEDLQFHREALGLRQQRQSVLASNIANADTPGYKARDIRFDQALKAAMVGQGQPTRTTLTLTSPQHIAAVSSSASDGTAAYRVPTQPRLDGNTVDMDVERVHFADNSLRYQAELTVVSTRLRAMMAALQS